MRFLSCAATMVPVPFMLIAGLLCVGSAFGQPSAFHPSGDGPDYTKPDLTEEAADTSTPYTQLEQQPLAARIAQLMLVTLEGVTKPAANDLVFLRSTVPGGVVIHHAQQAGAATAYINVLRSLEQSSGIPLLIGTNLYRLTDATRNVPSGFVQLPSLLSITAADDRDIVKSLGTLMAQHIRLMGFNFHFGPTLELAPNVPGAVTSIHTFGSSPLFAAEAGLLFQQAFSETGVLLMPAGFPGGGSNRVGRSAAVLTTPRPALRANDGLPYQTLIDRGVRLLHVGNVLAPTLDMDNRPASMSRAVISDILRGEMGFSGVVVAGPMDDEVLQTRYDPGEAALQALLAGADMLYWQGGLVQVMRAMARIEAAVQAGVLPEQRINEALGRLLALKQELAVPEKAVTERDALKQAGHKDLVEISRTIERHAITLLKNDGNILPLASKVSTPVGITGVAGVEELYELLEKRLKPLVRQRITTARHIGEIQRFEIERLTRHMKGLRTIVCVLSDDVRVETQVELLRALKENAPRVVVVYLGHPKNAAMLADADALLIAYSDAVNMAQTLDAMADILMGRSPISILGTDAPIQLRVGESRSFNAHEIIRTPAGRLPITLSERFPAGTAVRYNPEEAIRRVEWRFDGKRVRKENAVHQFDAPGEYIVTLTVTDVNRETHMGTFNIVVSE